ncbi:hypothetical protein RRSWK_03712 [Rhodopirellula sp. SWK7]|nr:hypothetical protein RRSWK_03712 [Rhodopirellula sp. SWK7]
MLTDVATGFGAGIRAVSNGIVSVRERRVLEARGGTVLLRSIDRNDRAPTNFFIFHLSESTER